MTLEREGLGEGRGEKRKGGSGSREMCIGRLKCKFFNRGDMVFELSTSYIQWRLLMIGVSAFLLY